MNVTIPPELQQFVNSKVASGACESESDVIAEALRVYRDIEQRREQLRRDIQEGIDSGEGIPASAVFERLSSRVQDMRRRADNAGES